MTNASRPPTNAAALSDKCIVIAVPPAITATAPRVAPGTMPMRYGSPSGLRTMAWMTVPAMASPAPTTRPSITRGTRSSHTICCSRAESPSAPTPSRDSTTFHTVSRGMDSAPIENPARTNAIVSATRTALSARNLRRLANVASPGMRRRTSPETGTLRTPESTTPLLPSHARVALAHRGFGARSPLLRTIIVTISAAPPSLARRVLR